jgi:RNA polymerase sigma factor (sigma-70 family)
MNATGIVERSNAGASWTLPGNVRMADASPESVQLQGWLERLQSGDPAALDGLMRHVCGRLERLTRRMLQHYPGVKRWAQTDDVLQSSLLRLLRALRAVQPDSPRAFFALATEQVRRELIDLARHYYGPQGLGAKHATQAATDGAPQPLHEPADLSHEPGSLAEWCEVHEHIRNLPEEECEVVGLLFYQGLAQAEAAAILGVNIRTVQRRWQTALLHLHQILKGRCPPL